MTTRQDTTATTSPKSAKESPEVKALGFALVLVLLKTKTPKEHRKLVELIGNVGDAAWELIREGNDQHNVHPLRGPSPAVREEKKAKVEAAGWLLSNAIDLAFESEPARDHARKMRAAQ